MKKSLHARLLLSGSLALTLSLWGPAVAVAQTHVSASVFNNAITLPGGAFLSPFHPGLDAGLTFYYAERPRHERYLQAQAGFYYQRLVHTGVQLYGEYHYRYRPWPAIALDGGAGLGALTTVLDTELFKLNENGRYEKAGKTRLHAQLSAALGVTYGKRGSRIQPFVQYRFRLFAPFIKSYVPVAPGTSVHFGAFYRLKP